MTIIIIIIMTIIVIIDSTIIIKVMTNDLRIMIILQINSSATVLLSINTAPSNSFLHLTNQNIKYRF